MFLNKPIKSSDFPGLSENIKTLSDFYICGTNNFALKADLEAKYSVEVTEDDLKDLHYVVNTTRQRLNILVRLE